MKKVNKKSPPVWLIFENFVKDYFLQKRIVLEKPFSIKIGHAGNKKPHMFDLGSNKHKILVECKRSIWTEGGNVPSAKMSTWNEAMYYFTLAPCCYRKIFVCYNTHNAKREGKMANLTLAEYYLDKYGHLVPPGVEIWEFCETSKKAERLC